MGFFAALAVPLISGIASSLFGSKGAGAQSKGLSAAARTQKKYQQEVLGLYRELLAEGKPLRTAQREFGMQGLWLSAADLMRPPGTSDLFQEAVGSLSSNFARYGLSPDSSAWARGTADLLARDVEDVRAKRLTAAGFGSTGVSEGMNLLGMAGGGAANLSSLQAQQGAVQGGLYGSIGQNLAQLPFAAALLNASAPGGFKLW